MSLSGGIIGRESALPAIPLATPMHKSSLCIASAVVEKMYIHVILNGFVGLLFVFRLMFIVQGNKLNTMCLTISACTGWWVVHLLRYAEV